MAASDHLSDPQFFHTSPDTLQPGAVLTREGAWRAKQRQYNPNITEEEIDRRAARHRQFNFEEPKESHLYYGDSSFVDSGEHTMYGGHTYAVQPETSRGSRINRHSPDPHYKNYGGGAYRTTGNLRVLHEVQF